MSDGLAPSIETGDGSRTYLHPIHGTSYRSLKGAATESRYVFLEGSRLQERPGPWRVLELGFGTGMNFQTTLNAARAHSEALIFDSLEPHPLAAEQWLVDTPWQVEQFDQPLSVGEVSLTIHRRKWQLHQPPEGYYDVLYHDPFGPITSPECWERACFEWGLRALKPDGVLATFGAAGATRRAMKAAGFLVGVLPGAPGKREMTVASSQASAIAHARPWKRS